MVHRTDRKPVRIPALSRLLKSYFGVRRLVAAFKSGQSEFQKPEENSSCVHNGDKSPHSKLAMRLSRAEFFSTLLERELTAESWM